MKAHVALLAITGLIGCLGCHVNKKPCITAVSLNNDGHWGKETGIPFYLPKPLLVISKNFRNIEEAKVGVTDPAPIPGTFDDQAKYADLNARTNFNFDGGGGADGGTQSGGEFANGAARGGQEVYSTSGAPVTPFEAPSDGLGPDTFYTYHIVFVPDLTQKYGLRIRGGPGEIRAAMNLVNGWQYTGLGPYYSKDSSTAQNILSGGIAARLGGQAARDVLSGVADLAGAPGVTQTGGEFAADDARIQKLSETISTLPAGTSQMVIPAFAEIHVYEPSLGPDGMMTWMEIASCVFNREYLGVKAIEREILPSVTPAAPGGALPGGPGGAGGTLPGGTTQSGGEFSSDAVTKSAIAAVFGVTPDSPAIQSAGGELQSGGQFATTPVSGANQVNVTCGAGCQKPCCAPPKQHVGLFSHLFKHRENAKVQRRVVSLPASGAANLRLENVLPTSGNSGGGVNDPGVGGILSGGGGGG